MDFLAPSFLYLLPVALLPWLWVGARREPIHTVIRSLLLAALIVAIARPSQVVPSKVEHHVYLLDQSPSISATDQSRAAAMVSLLQENAAANVKNTTLEWGKSNSNPISTQQEQAPFTLADALSAAARLIPDQEPGAIFLATDSQSRSPHWALATAQLSARDIPLHLLPMSANKGEVRVIGLQADGPLRQGHATVLHAILTGGPAEVKVQLQSSQSSELQTSVENIQLDGRTVVPLNFEASEAGFLELQISVEVEQLLGGHDLRPSDNHWKQVFAVQDATPVLYLGSRMQGGEAELSRLIGPGFKLFAPEELSSVEPADYPLVLLDDRPADTVPLGFQNKLVEAVRERGIGLMMCGGSAAFGPGGWQDTPVAEVLPVDFVQKEEKRDPSTTLVLIIDTSGSMGGNRVQLAKEVSRLAIHRLLPHDKVGIVEFYGAKRWAAPIQSASNSIELERALNRLDAGGGTVILPAVEEAFYGMQNVQTRYKHVLILTDGGVESGPFESMMRRMADKGINVSTVLIGAQAHSEFLVNLANWGKGRFYHVPNRFNLPEVILKQPASAKLPAYRPGEFALKARGSSAWWGSADPSSLPNLSGYVEAHARAGADVLLETVEGGHPVLASWRFGLGRVTALTTEPTGDGTANWANWPGYGAFLAQIMQRTGSEHSQEFRFNLSRQDAEVTLTATRLIAGNALPKAQVLVPNNPKANLSAAQADFKFPEWQQTAPGIFESKFRWPSKLSIRALAGLASADLNQPGKSQRLNLSGSSDLAPEFQVDPWRMPDLVTLAAVTGGQVLDAAPSALTSGAGQAIHLREFSSLLFVVALLLFLTDIFYRRRNSYRGYQP